MLIWLITNEISYCLFKMFIIRFYCIHYSH